jgi:hypothetical protein
MNSHVAKTAQLILFEELPSELAARLAEAELAHQEERAFYCLDCDVDTYAIDEYYILHHSVWRRANPAIAGMLCLGCLERRLGRQLTPEDFAPSLVNDHPECRRSTRLRARLAGAPADDSPPTEKQLGVQHEAPRTGDA